MPVYARCSKCGLRLRVSYDLLLMKYGARGSLINRCGICPNLDCDGGRYFYLAKSGDGLPFRPMRDTE